MEQQVEATTDQDVTSEINTPMLDLTEQQDSDKVIFPSKNVISESYLFPCPVCDRTFSQSALSRHAKICEKVNSIKRTVFNADKTKTKHVEQTPSPQVRKQSLRPRDEHQTCHHCLRKFGWKAYDRHVVWCEEKSRRLQASPVKDLVALSKLHSRTTYRPQTPRKSRSRRESVSTNSQTATPISFADPSGCISRIGSIDKKDSDRTHSTITRSFSNGSDISCLSSRQRTKESPTIQFIRAATGRGSIKRGPAETKASLLRKKTVQAEDSKIETTALPSICSPTRLQTGYYRTESPNLSSREQVSQALVKPSVVRPFEKISRHELRRDPEGIENDTADDSRSMAPTRGGISGLYDHSQEYDPYRSAARQMQELLFGSAFSTNQSPATVSLRPSSHSAFQKYIPANVPSTADINNLMGANSSPPACKGNLSESSSSHVRAHHGKVARFCHECGNPFVLPTIRFCCECGIKRLCC